MPEKKIIRIVPELDFGGVEQVLANSIPEIVKIPNLKVWVIVLGKGGVVEKELVRKGIHVSVMNFNPKIPNVRLLFKLKKLLSQIHPDVVHCQGSEANFHGLIAAKLAGVPVRIGEEIGFPNHHSYWRQIFRVVYKNATKVIAISKAVKDKVVELGEVHEEKVVVIYNPVSLGTRRKKNDKKQDLSYHDSHVNRDYHPKEKPFVFVTTGRLVPVKNLDRLINAFAELCHAFPNKTIELWIVGDGSSRQLLEDQGKSLGLIGKVRFWGFQSNVQPFLEESDAFVLSSLSEGSSVSLAEAMMIGLPSIVTKIGGAKEILGECKSGLLVDPFDENSILEGLKEIINLTKQQKEEMSKNAIKEVERFNVATYITQINTLYGFA